MGSILLPVIIGAVGGLIAFSHLLSWVFKRYRDETISLLTGFILGSLSILWPWQKEVFMLDEQGMQILKDGVPVVQKYEIILPPQIDFSFFLAVLFIFIGIFSIWLIENGASKSNT